MRTTTTLFILALATASQAQPLTPSTPLSDQELLGKRLFFDRNLSQPHGQSCATCHAPEKAFTDPDHRFPVSKGVIPGRFGKRNAPSAAYAAFSPPLIFLITGDETGLYAGGQFVDGRAFTLADQAEQPFVNPLEMHNPDRKSVVDTVRNATYVNLFVKVYGSKSLSDPNDYKAAYRQIAEAIAAFEASPELLRFSSKYDYYLQGKAQLTKAETSGLDLFNNKANCASCHMSTVVGDEPGPLFSDFGYDNIGIPKNWASPFLYLPPELNPDGLDFIDNGLSDTVAPFDPRSELQRGRFKAPSLRNLELTAPYGHNGYFKSIKEVVHFYNTRDVPAANWDAPEVAENLNTVDLGNLGLTHHEEDDLVSFLKTLTDGYRHK